MSESDMIEAFIYLPSLPQCKSCLSHNVPIISPTTISDLSHNVSPIPRTMYFSYLPQCISHVLHSLSPVTPTIYIYIYIYINNTIHMYSGITSGRVLNGELLYTKILEVNLFAFAYRLFRRDFSPLDGTYCMGTHSFLQPYMHFLLIWEGFMNGQS